MTIDPVTLIITLAACIAIVGAYMVGYDRGAEQERKTLYALFGGKIVKSIYAPPDSLNDTKEDIKQ